MKGRWLQSPHFTSEEVEAQIQVIPLNLAVSATYLVSFPLSASDSLCTMCIEASSFPTDYPLWGSRSRSRPRSLASL